MYTTVMPILFGVIAWIVGGMAYRRKENCRIHWIISSFISCGLSIIVFLLDIYLKVKEQDISSIRDLAAYYLVVSVIVWTINSWIHIYSYRKYKA